MSWKLWGGAVARDPLLQALCLTESKFREKETREYGERKVCKSSLFDAPCCCGKTSTVRGDTVGGLVGDSRPRFAFGNGPGLWPLVSSTSPPRGERPRALGERGNFNPMALEYHKMER